MLTKLYGEFGTIDNAEICAGRIKERLPAVRKISIREKTNINARKTLAYRFGRFDGTYFAVPMYNAAGIGILSPSLSDNNVIEPHLSEEALLSVICESADSRAVSQLILSSGGLLKQ